MQTSKRAVVIILICCCIILISYRYYKTQYITTPENTSYSFRSLPPPEPEVSTTTLIVGETKQIRGISITLKSIIEDSRCPVNVQCVQAGRVIADVIVKYPNETREEFITTDSSGGSFGYFFSATDVFPTKNGTPQIKPDDYKITISISR